MLHVGWNFVLSYTQMMNNIFTNNLIQVIRNFIVGISFDALFCWVTLVPLELTYASNKKNNVSLTTDH